MSLQLIGDIGGTHLRFALLRQGGILREQVLNWPDTPDLAALARTFLGPDRPDRAALAIAAQVTGDDGLHMPNVGNGYTFSQAALQRDLGLQRLDIVNDFTAIALAIPRLDPADIVQTGSGTAQPHKPIGVLGAGTGLGVSGLIWTGSRYLPLTGEGGHITMGAMNDREAAVLDHLRRIHGHVSAERVCSGMGLVSLHEALRATAGLPARPLTAADITAQMDQDPVCNEAVEMFCQLLGTVAGNLALTLGAFGGIYIAGGIVPKILPRFLRSGFRTRFCDKGRYRGYLDRIPTFVVTHGHPAYPGLLDLLDRPQA